MIPETGSGSFIFNSPQRMAGYLIFLVCLYAPGVQAQSSNGRVTLIHYMLDSFSNGKVLMKSGDASDQKLNYNLLTGEMIFDNAGKLLAIADPQEVDTVFIRQRKFIPVEGHFYEWLAGVQPALFKEYTCSVKEPGTETGFGATRTAAASSLNSLVKSGGAYALKLPDDFTVIPGYSYWVRKGTNYYKVVNARQLANLFPSKKEVVNEWLKKNDGRFSKAEDVIALFTAIQ